MSPSEIRDIIPVGQSPKTVYFRSDPRKGKTRKGTSLSSAKKAKAASGIKVLSPIKDPYVTKLLGKISDGKRILNVAMGETVFAQGEQADAIFFIESGKVKISVISSVGKEAVIVMRGPATFWVKDRSWDNPFALAQQRHWNHQSCSGSKRLR
jgi:hypothetical protein